MQTREFEQYLQSQADRGGISPETVRTYRSSVDQFAEWYGEAGEPGLDDMKSWVRHLAQNRGLANKTIRKHTHGLVKYLFSADRESVGTRLKNWVGEHYPTGDDDVPEAFSEAEVEALVEASREEARDAALVTILAATGCRAGEVVEIRVDDLSFTHPDEEFEGTLLVGRQKRNERVLNPLPLTAEDVEVLEAYLDKRDHYHNLDNTEWLFPSDSWSEKSGHHLSTASVRHRLKQVADRAEGVDPDEVHPHKFRHTVGSRLGRKGRTATEISRFLGQASSASAERYTHLDEQQFADMRRETQ
jgi:site-specific recombinase XerD